MLIYKQGILFQGGPADIFTRRIVLPDDFDPAVDNHIHSARLELVDGDHLESIWKAHSEGQEVATMTFRLGLGLELGLGPGPGLLALVRRATMRSGQNQNQNLLL